MATMMRGGVASVRGLGLGLERRAASGGRASTARGRVATLAAASRGGATKRARARAPNPRVASAPTDASRQLANLLATP